MAKPSYADPFNSGFSCALRSQLYIDCEKGEIHGENSHRSWIAITEDPQRCRIKEQYERDSDSQLTD